jgi:hypothetical protein
MKRAPLIGDYSLVINLTKVSTKGLLIDRILSGLGEIVFSEAEGGLIVISPIFGREAVDSLASQLRAEGLEYFDDFIEIEQTLPDWCQLNVEFRHDVDG